MGDGLPSTAAEWPDLAGRLTAEGHVLPVRVYFEDTDFSGIVYHGAFVRFLERGRSDFLRLSGVDHRALAEPAAGEPVFFALRDLSARFAAPARIDEVLEVDTRLAEATPARVVMAQAIRRDGLLLVSARVELCVVARDGRPRRMPSALRAAFAAPAEGP